MSQEMILRASIYWTHTWCSIVRNCLSQQCSQTPGGVEPPWRHLLSEDLQSPWSGGGRTEIRWPDALSTLIIPLVLAGSLRSHQHLSHGLAGTYKMVLDWKYEFHVLSSIEWMCTKPQALCWGWEAVKKRGAPSGAHSLERPTQAGSWPPWVSCLTVSGPRLRLSSAASQGCTWSQRGPGWKCFPWWSTCPFILTGSGSRSRAWYRPPVILQCPRALGTHLCSARPSCLGPLGDTSGNMVDAVCACALRSRGHACPSFLFLKTGLVQVETSWSP